MRKLGEFRSVTVTKGNSRKRKNKNDVVSWDGVEMRTSTRERKKEREREGEREWEDKITREK